MLSHIPYPLLQCNVPANCATPMANRCQGCSVCQKGFFPTGPTNNRQCAACSDGQALGVCTAYSSAGTSCVCTACADGWRLEQGTCVQCPANPNCDSYKANTCDCATCKANFSGNTCAPVGAGRVLMPSLGSGVGLNGVWQHCRSLVVSC